MAITDYTLDLKDAMDAHYGAGVWTYRTGTAGSGSDIGPALSAMITTIRALPRGRGVISIGPGEWELKTNNIDFSGIYLEGQGSQASEIWLDFSTGKGFAFSGNDGSGNSESGGGMKGLGIKLETDQGNTNVYGIYLAGNSTLQPDQMEFEDLYMTGGNASYFWDGIHCDGSARTSPQGIRIGTWKNIQIFNCRNTSFYGTNLVGHTFENLGTYAPLASTAGADVYFTGGGTATTNSVTISALGLNIGGNLHLTNCSKIAINGSAASTEVDSTTTYASGVMIGGISGTGGTSTSKLTGP